MLVAWKFHYISLLVISLFTTLYTISFSLLIVSRVSEIIIYFSPVFFFLLLFHSPSHSLASQLFMQLFVFGAFNFTSFAIINYFCKEIQWKWIERRERVKWEKKLWQRRWWQRWRLRRWWWWCERKYENEEVEVKQMKKRKIATRGKLQDELRKNQWLENQLNKLHWKFTLSFAILVIPLFLVYFNISGVVTMSELKRKKRIPKKKQRSDDCWRKCNFRLVEW